MTAVLRNCLQLCLLMHFSRDYYFVIAFVLVAYVVISFPLSSAGAGRQGQRCRWCGQLGRSSADLAAVTAAVGASLGLQPACLPWPPLQLGHGLPSPGIRALDRLWIGCYRTFREGASELPKVSVCKPQLVMASGTESVPH